MTPHSAIKKLHKQHKTLEQVRIMLGKKGIKTSVATLWRIMDNPKHEAAHKLSMALIVMAEAQQ